MASTSLLEGLVWGCSVGDHLADRSQPDCRDGLIATAQLDAVLDVAAPMEDAPPAPKKAMAAAWKALRYVLDREGSWVGLEVSAVPR